MLSFQTRFLEDSKLALIFSVDVLIFASILLIVRRAPLNQTATDVSQTRMSHETHQNDFEGQKPANPYLYLHPESHDPAKSNAIVCDLRPVTLSSMSRQEERPVYEALSYTWKPELPLQTIVCNGKERRVAKNLFWALQQLWKDINKTRPLWIDAVCIDQTIVWLSQHADDSELGMKYAHESQARTIRTHRALMESQLPQDQYEYRLREDNQMYQRENKQGHVAYVYLCRRAYFTRVWIVQEILVSPNHLIVCGSQNLSLDDFFGPHQLEFATDEAAGALQKDTFRDAENEELYAADRSPELVSSAILREALIDYRAGKRETLTKTLQRYRQFRATELKDKVFALVGISRIAGSPASSQFNFQSERSVSLAQVYKDTALLVMNQEQNVDIIGTPQAGPKQKIQGLPSWAPDWSDPVIEPYPLGPPNSHDDSMWRPFRSTRDSRLEGPVEESQGTILLGGIIVDNVSLLGREYPASKSTSVDDVIDSWIDVAKLLSLRSGLFRTKKWRNNAQAFERTLLAGFVGLNGTAAHRMFMAFWDYYWDPHGNMDPENQRLRADFFKIYVLNCKGRMMIKTEQGRLALVPAHTKKYDAIVLLKGGNKPFVLRTTSNPTYDVIGEAFVDGLMEGEEYIESACQPIAIC
ncbi:MAG: hypothetical protein M1820_002072 [Bogoriella megaspora]|nr:MAG: hypothetical protein M1820_002072 [Bogoriella megaspora]